MKYHLCILRYLTVSSRFSSESWTVLFYQQYPFHHRSSQHSMGCPQLRCRHNIQCIYAKNGIFITPHSVLHFQYFNSLSVALPEMIVHFLLLMSRKHAPLLQLQSHFLCLVHKAVVQSQNVIKWIVRGSWRSSTGCFLKTLSYELDGRSVWGMKNINRTCYCPFCCLD